MEKLPFNLALLKRVDDLKLSLRSVDCLKHNNIVYIGDLVQKTEQDLLRTRNFGRRSVTEVKTLLESMNLRLGMEVQGWPPLNPMALQKADASG